MSPEVQNALNQALVVLIPIFATWLGMRLKGITKDVDAAFSKLRAHENELGIQTRVEGGKIFVSSFDGAAPEHPKMDPIGIPKKGG